MSEACQSEKSHVAVLDHRVTQLEKVIESIDNSLKTLVALEVKHTQTASALERAFGEIEKHNTRLNCMEVEMPTMKMVRGWVIAGVIGIISLLGVEVMHLVIAKDEPRQQQSGSSK